MVITKKSPLSILIHRRVVNLACLKQRFDDCLFHFTSAIFFIIYNIFYQSSCILHFKKTSKNN